jgi:asparagine synthase (glutamine-hydrolysing)
MYDFRGLWRNPLWSTLCRQGHPSFTGLPVRFRYPFLDLRLLRFVARLPPDPWLVNKRILRDATFSRLPPEVRQRPKVPLVQARLPGHSEEAIEEVAVMVRHAPNLDQFVKREALEAALRANSAGEDARSERALSRPLGLAHWLLHWTRPALPAKGQAAQLLEI